MSEPITSFFIPGIPAPGGSKKPIPNRRMIDANSIVYNGRKYVDASKVCGCVFFVDDAKNNKSWMNTVKKWASVYWSRPKKPLEQPLIIKMLFVLPRPKGHYGTGKNAGTVKDSSPEFPVVKPDVLKLARSTEDALSGIIYKDDNTTIKLVIEKSYGDEPGVHIEVHECPSKKAVQSEIVKPQQGELIEL